MGTLSKIKSFYLRFWKTGILSRSLKILSKSYSIYTVRFNNVVCVILGTVKATQIEPFIWVSNVANIVVGVSVLYIGQL